MCETCGDKTAEGPTGLSEPFCSELCYQIDLARWNAA